MSEKVDWHGCYSNGWQNEIVPEAFSHPAKFARGLIRRIYEHAIEEGWLAEGDTVLDPFAGVALGGLDAMFHGLNWVGVELEGKFVDLGSRNIGLWNSRYGNGRLPRWGTAFLLQGDSRRLCEVLGGTRAQGVVASPPYAESISAGGYGIDWSKVGPATGNRRRGEGTQHEATLRAQLRYSTNPANLGNMREGDHEEAVKAVVSSPPYAESLTQGNEPEGYDYTKYGGGGQLATSQRYGDSPGQLGAMREGDVDAVISSPPFADAKAHPSIGSVNKDDWGKDGRDIVTRRGLTADYGQSPGQLAAMPEGEFEAQAVVSSPPWEATLGRDVVDKDARCQWAREHDISNAEFVTPIDMGRIGCRDQEYGATAGQLGNEQGDTFWSAARLVVEQCHQVLVPGGMAIWVVKDFVRDKKRVPFCEQWRRMCEVIGFVMVEEIRTWLVEDRGGQYALNGDLVEQRVERKSFFRRLAEKKGSPRIDWEIVLCMRKAI